VAVGLDGNPVLTGGSNSDDFADIRTAKFDGATGALLWSVSFDGGFLDYPGSIAVTSGGNPVVVGNSDDEIVVGPRLIMYDGATGATLWDVFLAYDPLVGQVEARGVAVGPDSNLIVTGDDSSGQTIFTTKIDSLNGEVLWSRFWGCRSR
jgi:DNA-binding beta-propeller fold protein YncE